jgi:hypothetical protein
MKRSLGMGVVLAAALTQPVAAQMQLGPGLGWLSDVKSDFLVITGDARFRLPDYPIVINPRFDLFMGEGTTFQIDANALYQLPLAAGGPFTPYAGLGVALNHFSQDVISIEGETETFSDNTVGLNWIFGTTMDIAESPLQLYAHAQYTAAVDFANTMVVYAGVLFRIGGGGS